MNKNLIRIGGALNLLFVLFHLAMVKPIDGALASLPADIRAGISPVVSMLDIHVAYALLIFACLAILRWRDLLTTRLGNILLIAISLFWFLRAVNQVVFYGPTAAGIPMIAVCLLVGLLHLVPALRAWNNVPAEGQPQAAAPADRIPRSQEPVAGMPWTSYAVVAWCVLFGGLHLYWALGGTAGFAEFSMPSNKVLALTRDPLYMAITWGVVLACVVGIIVALVPFQAWSRRIPRWMLLTPLWIACAMLTVRGVGNPVQTALIIGGGMPFDPLPASEVQAWNQWLLIDAILYSPYFILGGLAFGATARAARRFGAAIGGRGVVSAGQA